MAGRERVVSLRGVRKDYHALRPLRVDELTLRRGQTVALLGFDRPAAEVLVNLITGATLPDAGEIDVLGSSTRAIATPEAWFRLLDDIGLLSERVVLIDELDVAQNLALPLSLDVEAMAPDVRARVERLGVEVGIEPDAMNQPMAKMGPAARTRVRLGKALAADPQVLLAEHPTAGLPPEDVPRFAADLSAIAARRVLALLVLTADTAFAAAACREVLSLRPATGALETASGWWRRFTKRVR